MNVLMLSIDRGLLGQGQLGDVVERHREYGKRVDKLDIIVMSKKGYEINKISDNVTSYPTNSKSSVWFLPDAVRLAKRFSSTDLIVCQDTIVGLVGYFIKRKTKAKLLVNLHGDYVGNQLSKDRRYNSWWGNLISKFVLKRADAIRVMSQGIKDRLVKMDFDANKIKVISTPVDIEKYQHPHIKQVASFRTQGHPTLLHVSRYDEAKDFDTLFEAVNLALKKMPKLHFWQVGARKKLEVHYPDQMASYTGNAAFRMDPLTEPNSLINIYHAVDLVVSSSQTESFGKVLVEANACGKPVVATATTGAQEIVKDGYNGYLVPIGDAKKLAEKILELLKDPGQAKRMGENGRKLVKETFGNNTQKIIDYWQEIVS